MIPIENLGTLNDQICQFNKLYSLIKILKITTITITFRIDSDIMRQMKEKAEQDGIAYNTLVGPIFKIHRLGMHVENRAGIIPLTRPVAYELFKRLSKEVTNLAVEVGKNAVYDITLFMRGGINRVSFIDWFLSRMRNSSTSVVSKSASSGHKAYVMKHDMGENWSLYHKTIMEAIFHSLFFIRLHTYSNPLLSRHRNLGRQIRV